MPRRNGLPKYVKEIRSRHGRSYYYFRHRETYQRLPDDPNSPEFYQRYGGLLAVVRAPARPLIEGSIASVIADFKDSEEFRQLAPKTQRDYARMLDCFAPFGQTPIEEFKRRHVREIQKEFGDKSRTAKLFAQVASRLFGFAIELDLIDINPAARMKRLGRVKPYQAWTDDECAKFERKRPPRPLMTAYMLGRHTGQRLGDILKLLRSAYNGLELHIRQSKTGVELSIPVLPVLKSYLDSLPRDTALFVTRANGSAYDETAFRHEFRATLNAAGLKQLHFHGLRHQAGRSLAEAGCSQNEIMAILGHRTPAMASHYTRTAEQKRLSRSAIAKWAASKRDPEEGD